ncbi:hypothetical protein [Bartonella raoultii]|uniref:hypothetical protein n=1 Tax=Bartonella raoultii TaxID=1457020 RepID=UPI001ABABDF7|nr:hypothetical protein [Bartonella raoultii]
MSRHQFLILRHYSAHKAHSFTVFLNQPTPSSYHQPTYLKGKTALSLTRHGFYIPGKAIVSIE